MPAAIQQFFDSSGNPLSGGTLTFYAAGTTTPQTVYSDSSVSVPLSNPLTLDSAGRTSTPVYLSGTVSYKILLKNSAGTTIWTADNQAGAQYLAVQAVQPAVQTTTATGTQNDFLLTCGSVPLCVLRVNNSADTTFTGFRTPVSGQRLLVLAVGSANVFLSHQGAASTPAYRTINYATTISTPLAAGTGTAEFVYDSTTARWRMSAHEQGAAITYTPTITAQSGTFTSVSGSGRYFVTGRKVQLQAVITVTTIGTAGGYFIVPLPYTAAASAYAGSGVNVSSGGVILSTYVGGAATTMLVFKYDGTAPTASNQLLLANVDYEVG